MPAVRDEIEYGTRIGHDYLNAAIEEFDGGPPIIHAHQDSGCSTIRERLDPGEAESLRGVIEHDGTLATDDLAARRFAEERNRPFIGSIGLLVLGIERDSLDRETADIWLDTWRDKRGYYAPVESVADVLDDGVG